MFDWIELRIKGVFVSCLQAGVLGGRCFWEQHTWVWFRTFLPAKSRHDGRKHLLHLHSGRLDLQPTNDA